MAKVCNVGGQALIEGVMMRGVNHISIAVRQPDNSIVVKVEEIPKFYQNKIFKLPILRGIIALISSMTIGIDALSYSAEMSGNAEEETKFDKYIKEKFKDKSNMVLTFISVFISIFLAIIIFGIVPTFMSNFFKSIIKNSFMLSMIEGLFKLFIFLTYIFLISKLNDVHRVFEYHGAEHMSIHCLEEGLELNVENVKKFSPVHERCGTAYLIYLMILSITIYSFITWNSIFLRIFIKILLLPIIAGLGYELLKVNAYNMENKFLKILSKPGLLLQKITTQFPDDAQIEVAIAALNGILEKEREVNN